MQEETHSKPPTGKSNVSIGRGCRTILTDQERKQLAQNYELGAGNFLRYALDSSPNPAASMLFLEKGVKVGHEFFSDLSLNDLDEITRRLATWYRGEGVRSKDPVAIYLDDGVEYLLHYLALTLIGAVPVLINGNMDARIAAAHAHRVGSVGFIGDGGHLPPLEFFNQFRFVKEQAQVFASLPDLMPQSRDRDFTHVAGDPIMIAHSSGTTGIPKAVPLEHDRFFYGIRYRLGQPAVPGGSRILSSLPHSHNCAIAYIMLALLSGHEVYITSDHTGEAVLRSIEQFQPSMVVSFPQTYVEMAEAGLDRFDLSSVALWFNGGDAAHEAHIRKLVAQGRHPSRVEAGGSVFVDGFGSSEMGFSLFKHIHNADTDHYGRCIGKPHEWVRATIFDDEGNQLGPHQIGRLGVKAPSVMTGYWNDTGLTHRSRIAGYFLTGDLAFYDERGRFYHIDRTPDAIDTRKGRVFSLWTEEIILASFPEVSDCSVFAQAAESSPAELGEARGAIAVASVRLMPGQNHSETELLRRINATLKNHGRPAVDRLEIVTSADIPLGTTGKVLKRELRQRHAS